MDTMDTTQPSFRARELVPFALITFGMPFLMGIPLYFAQRAGYDTSVFANAQMYYPAAGAMAALLLTRRGQELPRRFFLLHLLCTAAMAVCCVGSAITGGVVGLLIMAALAWVGGVGYLTPVNILLYQLIWLVPGLLVTEWTRHI